MLPLQNPVQYLYFLLFFFSHAHKCLAVNPELRCKCNDLRRSKVHV
jgi:hypothetical protein